MALVVQPLPHAARRAALAPLPAISSTPRPLETETACSTAGLSPNLLDHPSLLALSQSAVAVAVVVSCCCTMQIQALDRTIFLGSPQYSCLSRTENARIVPARHRRNAGGIEIRATLQTAEKGELPTGTVKGAGFPGG